MAYVNTDNGWMDAMCSLLTNFFHQTLPLTYLTSDLLGLYCNALFDNETVLTIK